MSNRVVTAPFRLAFPQIFSPKAASEGYEPKYSIHMLFSKDGSTLPNMPSEMNGKKLSNLNDLRKLAYSACVEKWGPDTSKWPPRLRALDMKTYLSPDSKEGWPFRDGDLVSWNGYKDMVFLKASSKQKPGLVDRSLRPIIGQDQIFGGLICVAEVNAFTYDVSGAKGISFGLDNIMVLADDGTRYSARKNPDEVFSAFGDAPSEFIADSDPWK